MPKLSRMLKFSKFRSTPKESTDIPDNLEKPQANAVSPGKEQKLSISGTSKQPTLRNTLAFLATVAGNAPVPFIKLAAVALTELNQRLDNMGVNRQEVEELLKDTQALLYLVNSYADKIDPGIRDQFLDRLQSIQKDMPEKSNAVARVVNANSTRDLIARLRQRLDSANQLLQTGLQLSQVQDMQMFKDWVTTIDNNKDDNTLIREHLGLTFKAGGNINFDSTGANGVKLTLSDSDFTTGKAFSRRIQGAAVHDQMSGTSIDATEDIDMSAFATGSRSNW